jgi:serine protease Do
MPGMASPVGWLTRKALGAAVCAVFGTLAFTIAAPRAAHADDDEPATPSPSQKQAMYAKPSVVRIYAVWEVEFSLYGDRFPELIGGSGSGFFISSDGYIATNAHVVNVIHDGEEKALADARAQLLADLDAKYGATFAKMSDRELRQIVEAIKLEKAVPHAEVILPDGTTLPYEIKAYGAPVGEGSSQDCAIIKVDLQNAPNLPIGDSDKAQIQDHILAIGYPGVADLNGLLDEKSQLEASITDGSIAAIKRTTGGEPVLQITAPISHGNSGGPAINDKGEVIGLVTFGDAKEVQGFNFLVSAKTLMKFVKESKADLAPSQTTQVWHRALDGYWDRYYEKAIIDFEEVMTLFPTHSEAPKFVKLARQYKKAGKGRDASAGGGSSTAIVIGLFAFAGLAGLLAVVFIKRSKKPPQPKPAGAGAYPPPPGPPGPPSGPPGAYPPPPGPPPMGMPGYPPPPRPGSASGPNSMYPPPGPPPGAYPPPPAGYQTPGAQGPGVVAKTVAISGGHAPVAATAFGSLTVGTLTCTRGLLAGQRFSLSHQGLLIGRQPGLAQVVVNDSRASGKHVWIGYENGTLVAIDQGTTNGTFVNDVRNGRISKAPLRDGDTVIVAEPDVLSLQLKL